MTYDDINFVHALFVPNERARDVERAKHVLLYIASRSGNGKGCWASQETMAKELPMPLRAVERAIRMLKRLGLIVVTRRAHKSSIITINRKWVPSPDNSKPPTYGGSRAFPEPSSGDGSGTSPDPSIAGGSQMSAKPPISVSQTAIEAADKHHEHAGRSVRDRAAPFQGQARTPHLRSRFPEKDNEHTEAEPPTSQPAPMITFSGRSASLTQSDSRAADPPLGGEAQPETLPPAVVAAAHSEADKRSAYTKPAPLDLPIITPEQRRENEAVARLNADLIQSGLIEEAIEWINDDRRARAVAAEVAERGAGVSLVRSEMLQTANHASKGR
ncbi:MAG: hypothetical protein EOR67_25950 [Mesorhizobium sp.]|uniref:helix-turn-helix domain-containing protein n=1 Tax=Mesorhizobium sp. TaxID=1871066 RepID=UPI000FE809E3|nr:helix-turn-helix domain-containing protein [Mesorhizobium sp.]RWL79409.1 MAG: hypothetical protein EOR69_25490 [Mesorhizobium sp.]RWL83171.1 MAG: hypothetical protein EOR67_25950 [Mesorhizobium sp.]RWL93975.1 MAG: hypothetical protein EOR70_26735 [Mesorhizobium sp.]